VYRIKVAGPDGEKCLHGHLIRHNIDEETITMAVNAGDEIGFLSLKLALRKRNAILLVCSFFQAKAGNRLGSGVRTEIRPNDNTSINL
jgi:hypothetical protein